LKKPSKKDMSMRQINVFGNLTQLVREAELARAYIRITQEQGHSEQLLAFINYDNSLGTALGLEDFNSLGLNTRHELALLKLNPEVLSAKALEGFLTTLLGLDSKVKKTGEDINNPSPHSTKKICEYSIYQGIKKSFVLMHQFEQDLFSRIPKSMDEGQWSAFADYVSKTARPRLIAASEQLPHEADGVDSIDKSGWNKANFATEAKALKVEGDKYLAWWNNSVVPVQNEIKRIADADPKGLQKIFQHWYNTIGGSGFGLAIHDLSMMNSVLESVAGHLGEKYNPPK
jgi:hypothetical protein